MQRKDAARSSFRAQGVSGMWLKPSARIRRSQRGKSGLSAAMDCGANPLLSRNHSIG